MFPDGFFSVLFLILYYGLIIFVFLRILLENKNPLKAQSYLLLLVLLPVVGLVIYLLFGVNFRKRKLYSRKAVTDQVFIKEWIKVYEERLTRNRELAEDMLQEKYKLPYLFFRNGHSVLTVNNRVQVLNNGEEKFPVLLERLAAARHHIHFEYYILVDDNIGTQVINVLIERARAGVEVRVIYDAIGGSAISGKALTRMLAAGIEISVYNPVIFTTLANRVNYRDHRKIVVIDGKVGFLGGINVADYYINGPETREYWRDVHCMIEGDANYYLQMLFLLNWYFLTKELITPNPDYFPTIEQETGVAACIVGSSPDSESQNMMEAYFSLITNARREILITTPYLIPNEGILTALKTAAKSGVDVKILLPQYTTTHFVHAASLTYVEELLQNDIKIYLYQRGMVHSKVLVVDELVCTVGTANLDYRSLDNNAEVNAFFFDEETSLKLKADFEADIRNAICLNLEDWMDRPWWLKLFGSVARLAAPLL